MLNEMISQLKQERGLTYRELAKEGKAISYNFLCEIANGKWLPKTEKLVEFCKNLGIQSEPYVKALILDKAGPIDKSDNTNSGEPL